MPMKRLATYVVLLLLPLFVVACGGREIDSKLDIAEAVMSERPDSALTILRTIDADKLYSPSRKARYSLLSVQADDKNYIDSTDDTIIRYALDYYEDSDDDYRKMLSYYYLGRIQSNNNQTIDALCSFNKAEELIECCDDYYAIALIHMHIGFIYRGLFDFEKNYHYLLKGKEYYERAGKTRLMRYAQQNVGQALISLFRYDDAERELKDALAWSMAEEDNELYTSCTNELFKLYQAQRQFDKAIELYEEYVYNKNINNLNTAVTTAQYYAFIGRCDIAAMYVDAALSISATHRDSIKVKHLDYHISKNSGDYERALTLYEDIMNEQDSVVRRALSHPVETMQRDYFKSVADYNRLKVEHQRFIIFGAIVFVVVISLLFYVYIRSKNAQVQHYMEMACDMRTSLFIQENNMGEIVSTMSSMQEQIASLFSRQYSLIDKLCSTYYETHSSNTTRDAIYKQVKSEIERLSVDVKYIRNLESIVNQHKQNAIAICREQAPELTEMEVRVLIYLLAGFSAKAISIFTNDSVGNIYTKKNRLKNKLRTINTPEINSVLQLL